jgi:hypothetical protein
MAGGCHARRLTGTFDAAINLLYFVGPLLSFRETVRAEPVEVRTWRFR